MLNSSVAQKKSINLQFVFAKYNITMIKRLLFSLLLLVVTIQNLNAQNFIVKGQVIDRAYGEPLIGLTILQEETGNGVTTDLDGNYSIEIRDAKEATLVFSYMGMKTQTHVVTEKTKTLNVIMEDDSHLMEDVVVVAYGVRKKGTITGSVSTIKADKMENVPTAGFDQALQGQAAGLSVISNSGEPSKAATFQIRGTNSINSGTAPLFILDGVPIEASDFNTINPADIESTSILKDAASTSIYGARAANGVIVITTKRGTNTEKPQITLRSQVGVSQLARTEWNLMNTAERIAFEKEIGLDEGQDYDILSKTNINWMDMVFNDRAMLQNYDVSIGRATDKLNYFVSGNFFDQDGIAQSSMFRRYTLRANADVTTADWMKVGTNTMFTYEEVEQAEDGSYTLFTPISASRFMLPYWNPYRKDGSLASEKDGSWAGTGSNPIEWMENNPYTNKKYKILNVLYVELKPIKNLTWRSQLGIDFTHSTSFMQSFPSYAGNNNDGVAGRGTQESTNLTITNTANYQFKPVFGHSLTVMLGQEGINFNREGFSVTTRGQNNDFLTDLSSGTRATSWSSNGTSYGYLSFFGRGEYSYNDKYYLDFALRADASSRFGKNNRWAAFWSVGFMWNALKEDFLKNNNWLTNAQVAFSTGTSGNSSIPNYDHLTLVYGGANYLDAAGLYLAQLGNGELSWEHLWNTNLGLHAGFFGRINVDLELYNKRTSNMLMQVPASYADNLTGFRWDNVGVMVNRGIEANISADIISTQKFNWNVNSNVSYNHNEIIELYNGIDEYERTGSNTKLVVGHSSSEFYINRYAGVNPANGDALWLTKDDELTTEYNEADKVMIGKSFVAPWQGGFGTTISWNGLSLSSMFSWVANRWMINNDRFFEESNGLYSVYNQSRRLLYDRWKKPGDITDIPRYGITPQMDSRFLENASFLRLKNLTLNYTLPASLLKKSKAIERANVYIQGQNLFTITDFTGIDPEATGNVYQAQYPMSRQFTLGLDITF